MNTVERKYITGTALSAFMTSFYAVSGADTGPKLEVVRVSVRTEPNARRVRLLALLAIADRPAGCVFELVLTGVGEAELGQADLARYGHDIAQKAQGWADSAAQARAQADAMAAQYNVWESTEIDDHAQDLVDDWEATWRAHLGGKVYARAKIDLVRSLAAILGTRMPAVIPEAAARMAKVRAAKRVKEAGYGDQ